MLRNISRRLQTTLPQYRYLATVNTLCSMKKLSDEEIASNEPIKYFGSNAAIWRAKDTRSGGAEEALWYQPYVISGSLAIFLTYFCFLREESDIDRKLEGSLYDHVSGLEELQLIAAYKYNKENGLDAKKLESRLIELGIDVKCL